MNREADRVRDASPEAVNRRISAEMIEQVRIHGSSPAAIGRRLRELDREWDIERTLFAITSINMLMGLTVSSKDRRWLAWPFAVAGFQLQHAIHGWCPPVSVLRRLGVRTRQEIDAERVALKAVRGDFDRTDPDRRSFQPESALEATLR